MSETVRYKGKLIKVSNHNDNLSIEDICKKIYKESYECPLPSYYYSSYTEYLTENCEYVVLNNELYKIQREQLECDDDICEAVKNNDGSIDFHIMYYNGGVSFQEMIQEVFNIANAEEQQNEFITISKAEYECLRNRDFKLDCLENAGVDNWEGYDFAMEEFYKTDEDDEYE